MFLLKDSSKKYPTQSEQSLFLQVVQVNVGNSGECPERSWIAQRSQMFIARYAWHRLFIE